MLNAGRFQPRVAWLSRVGVAALACAWPLHLAAQTVAANDLPPLALESEPAGGYSRAEAARRAAALTVLGQKMFFDASLSASGKVACATCHSPAFAFGPPNGSAVQFGGADLRQPGLRAVPGLTYLQTTPPFTPHYYESDEDGDESIDNGPTGGLTWDGRVSQVREQAKLPLLSDFEMGHSSAADVVARARAAGDLAELQRITHDDRLATDDGAAFDAIGFAFEVFLEDPRTFDPYTSKYDAYLRHQVALSEPEARGLALFNDPEKGNCASCHISKVSPMGVLPALTDHGMIALGAPRNPAIPANEDPAYFDLGLCGPLRTDYQDTADYCGRFKTPSLRNVALRKVFMHNGVFHSLRDTVAFYVERDTRPENWYPVGADGVVEKYNDLPPRYRGNVNDDPPFGPQPGNKPVLSDAEIDDVVAFLNTLTDGFVPTK